MPSLPQPSFRQLLEFALNLADTSGRAILPYFRKSISIENKADQGEFDPVTAADKAAERVIRKAIARTWPGHGLIGEEYDDIAGEDDYSWVIDPIDGTRAFIMGYPTWGTLIGLLHKGKPQLGVMDQPFTGERYWSGAKASYLRSGQGKARRLSTRPCARLSEATLATTHPDLFEPGLDASIFEALKAKANMTRYGGDCYAYCMLASGLVDIIVETGLKPHDIVALIPIIERAGGRVTTWDGGSAAAGGRIIATGDARLHRQALRLIAAHGK